MLFVPFEVPPGGPRGPIIVVMILEKENLDRMREADPFDVQFRAYLNFVNAHRPIHELDLVIAYEEDINRIMEFKKRQDVAGLITWLERGRVHRPGDALPPVPLRKT
jgi:hypothetical protein